MEQNIVTRPFEYPKESFICFICGLFGIVAKIAVFVFISMLITSKSICLIVAVLTAYVMMDSVLNVEYRLNQTKTMEVVEFDYATGEMIGTKIEDNPMYIENSYVRDFCEFYICFVPQGQDSTYMSFDYMGLPENIGVFPIYSMIFSGIFTGTGVIVFRRKDLK